MAGIRDILSARRKDPRFHVRVAVEGDLPAIAKLDVGEYYGSTVVLRGLQEWFATYPRGAFVLEDRLELPHSQIVGAFGIWPVSAAAYKKLITGKLNESEIRGGVPERDWKGGHICPSAKRPRYRYWYVADIIVEEKYRKKGLGKSKPALCLLRESLAHWNKFHDFDENIELCAIATGIEGPKLLEDFNFHVAKSSRGETIKCETGDTIYKRSMSGVERKASFEEVEKLYKKTKSRSNSGVCRNGSSPSRSSVLLPS